MDVYVHFVEVYIEVNNLLFGYLVFCFTSCFLSLIFEINLFRLFTEQRNLSLPFAQLMVEINRFQLEPVTINRYRS